MEKKWKPILRRIYVFWMPEKNILEFSSGVKLYSPRALKGAFSEGQIAYIAECASDCEYGPDNGKWPRGSKVVVTDGFEINSSDGLDLWPAYQDDTAFAELKSISERIDSPIKTGILSESSILGLID